MTFEINEVLAGFDAASVQMKQVIQMMGDVDPLVKSSFLIGCGSHGSVVTLAEDDIKKMLLEDAANSNYRQFKLLRSDFWFKLLNLAKANGLCDYGYTVILEQIKKYPVLSKDYFLDEIKKNESYQLLSDEVYQYFNGINVNFENGLERFELLSDLPHTEQIQKLVECLELLTRYYVLHHKSENIARVDSAEFRAELIKASSETGKVENAYLVVNFYKNGKTTVRMKACLDRLVLAQA